MDRFAPNSRYYGLPTRTFARADGREVVYVARRVVPPPEAFATLGAVTVEAEDRPDGLAARAFGDPESWWRLADGEAVMDAEELVTPVGRRVRTTLPGGLVPREDDLA